MGAPVAGTTPATAWSATGDMQDPLTQPMFGLIGMSDFMDDALEMKPPGEPGDVEV